MESVITWLTDKTPSARLAALTALVGTAIALTVLGGLILPTVAAPLVGAAAGGALFTAAVGYWHTMLHPDRKAATDLKARYRLAPRRRLVGVLGALWVIVLLLTRGALPDLLGGTLNVWVVLHLVWLFRATPVEAEAQRAAEASAHPERAKD